MRPSLSPLDPVDAGQMQPVLLRQHMGRDSALPDGERICLGDFSSPISVALGGSFGMQFHTADMPTLGVPVHDVIFWCSKKQVARVNAQRDIAAMADAKPRRDGTIGNRPRKPVGTYVVPVQADGSVAVPGTATSPQPAATSFGYSLPESSYSFFLRNCSGHAWYYLIEGCHMRSDA